MVSILLLLLLSLSLLPLRLPYAVIAVLRLPPNASIAPLGQFVIELRCGSNVVAV